MKTPLKILHLEDNRLDAELIQLMLNQQQIPVAIRLVDSRHYFEAALKNDQFDLILSDYSLPGFNGMEALALARVVAPKTPFIFVSGTIGEELAVESLKAGATNYVLKGRLSRLGEILLRAHKGAQQIVEMETNLAELKRSGKLFRQITENVDDLIAVVDLDGRRVFNSHSYARILGLPQQLLGSDSYSEIHPDDRERIKELFLRTIATGKGERAEYRFLLKDGDVRFIESQGSVICDERGRIKNILVVSRDVTTRKEAENQIKNQAALLDKAQDAICVTKMDGTILYWNKGAEKLYRWLQSEVMGRSIFDLLFSADFAPPAAVLNMVMHKDEWKGEQNQVTKEGKNLIVESRWSLMRDLNGNPESVLILNSDITEKKQIESQFLRAQRMESIGALASGIAHDLNNVLTPILMAAECLKNDSHHADRARLVETITNSTRRGSEMVKQILSFARGVGEDRQEVNLQVLIKDIWGLLNDTFSKSILLSCDLSPDLYSVCGNPTQLHQVFLNLCVNARDAMPDGGGLSIEARNIVIGSAENRRPAIRVRLADTGTGIPKKILDKIYDPFFTTKELGKGTGLGLSTVMAIVKSHEGTIEVESEPEKGTVFTLVLPGVTTHLPRTNDTPAEWPCGEGETVLLVDDEEAICAITRATLETFNYQVLTGRGSREALSHFHGGSREIAVVITDLMMPEMDGSTLIRLLREKRSDIKIICSSGSISQEKLKEIESLNVQGFLTKPYTTCRLLATLRQVITRSYLPVPSRGHA